MQAGLVTVALALVALAIFSGWRDFRRARRRDLDRVSLIDWPTVQVFALIAAAIVASVAFNL